MSSQERVEALRCLQALLAAGLPVRQALLEWPARVPGEQRAGLARVARRVALGAPLARALAGSGLDADGEDLAAALTAAESGADGAALVGALAAGAERRALAAARARAAASGVLVSARVVAALPLVCLLALPLSGAPPLDRVGVALLAAGCALDLAGALWLAHLSPAVAPADPAAALAERLAAALAGGLALRRAVEICSGFEPDLRRAARRLAAGASWERALGSIAGGAELGRLLERCERHGLAPARALSGFAAVRRAAAEAEAERALRRAPVLMMFPLTVCVLPAFLLLGVIPHLRALPV